MGEGNDSAHWDRIFDDKPAEQLTWYQQSLSTSLSFIDACELSSDAPIIDVGGGASTLVDDLVARGYTDLSVLDLSSHGLAIAQKRLGPEVAGRIHWIVGDVTTAELPAAHYELWHDRAAFHFLLEESERQRYVEKAARCVAPGGHLVIATFSVEGPERCSGLPARRYDADALARLFAEHFAPVSFQHELHHTPRQSTQSFLYCHMRRRQ
jgi:ubiquinone/menaquinone biosynthesis C-methylase UbiE